MSSNTARGEEFELEIVRFLRNNTRYMVTHTG